MPAIRRAAIKSLTTNLMAPLSSATYLLWDDGSSLKRASALPSRALVQGGDPGIHSARSWSLVKMGIITN